jgi:hypothetical protein
LGEAALTLASNVDYEIPLLRKQAAAWNAQLSDLEKKEEETAAAARAAATTFKKDCAALDIAVRVIPARLRFDLIARGVLLPQAVLLCGGREAALLIGLHDFAGHEHSTGGAGASSASPDSTVRDR